MALSELSIHNAVRTYARQQQTGCALRVRRELHLGQPFQEQIALSNEARNLQQIRHLAAELVGRLRGDLSPLDQLSLSAGVEQEMRERYAEWLKGELVPAEVVEEWMRSLKVVGFEG